MEIIVAYRLSMTAAAALVMYGAGAAAEELLIYQVEGFPITPHRFVALGPANAEQGPPTLVVTVAGMPASPHQITVLSPHHKARDGKIAGGGQQTTGQVGLVVPAAIETTP